MPFLREFLKLAFKFDILASPLIETLNKYSNRLKNLKL